MEHTDLKSMTQQNLPEDQQIVRLFFKRSEKAITYTRQNMDHSVSVLPGGFYQIREMQKNV